MFTGAFSFCRGVFVNFFDGVEAHRTRRGAEEDDEDIMETTQIPKARAMRAARGRLGLTQFDLARRARCSESQIAKIETGRVTPPDWLKEAIARELGIKTWEIGV